MDERTRDEVIGLHRFFEEWFGGTVLATEDVFARCRRVLAPGFALVSPRAVVEERDGLLESIWKAHGKMPGMRIWIEDLACRRVPGTGDLATVVYKEWQERDGVRTGRLSSALMAADARAPCAVVWLHLHETWVQGPASRVAADPVLARFEAGQMTLAEFDHERHVEVAWRYVRAYPLAEALARFAEALKRFAAAHGKGGLYHETITWAYMVLIKERAAAPDGDWDGFRESNPDLLTRGKHALARYYSDERLWSDAARANFVLPDRGPGTTDGE